MEKSLSSLRVAFATAGLGSADFESAAYRVSYALSKMYPFSYSIVLTTDNLGKYCPEIYSDFKAFLKPDVKGFGFMSWKAELSHNVLRGDFGEVDVLIWVDAGCEIFDSYWTRRKFKRHLKTTLEVGHLLFSLDTPENQYTKRDVLTIFGEGFLDDNSPQIQSTFFGLSRIHSFKIVEDWYGAIKNNIKSIDDSISEIGESADFIQHTSDQSVFSLACKANGAGTNLRVLRAGNRGLLSQISAMRDPIWASRNRFGTSIIYNWLLKFGRISNLRSGT